MAIIWVLSASSAFAEELPTVIALFGDSITTGYNADFASNLDVGGGTTTKGRPTIELKELMEGPPVRNVIVANWGDGGTSSSFGLGRIDDDLDENTDDFPGSEYFVLIMYGTNDPGQGISSSTTGFNIEKMIEEADDRGYTAIVGTIPPRSDQSVTSRNIRIAAAAAEEGAPLVDIYDRFTPNYKGILMDSETSFLTGNTIYLHPNMAGYEAIAEEWFYEELESRIDPVPDPVIIAPIISLLLD